MTSLAVCIDCAQRGANGYEPERVDYETDHPARYVAAVIRNDGAEPMPTGDGGEHFSKHPCPFCGSLLAGSRIDAELVAGDGRKWAIPHPSELGQP